VVVQACATVYYYSLIISAITALQQAHTQLYEGDTLARGEWGSIQLLFPMNKLLLQDATAGGLCSALLRRAVRVHACPRGVHYTGERAHTLALVRCCSLLCTIRCTLLSVRLGIGGRIQLVSQRVRD
jgi:hypothetical protein